MFQLDTDIYTKNRQMNLAEKMGSQSMAASQQEMGLNDEKMKSAKIERAVQYLSMATPENWPAIRSQAISEGLGNEQVIPQQFDPNWIQQTKSAFMSASNNTPASVQEFNFWKRLGGNKQEQDFYGNMLSKSQVINLGGTQAVRNPLTGNIDAQYPVTPKPDEDPLFKREQERQKAIGDATGKAEGAIEKKVIQAPQVKSLLDQAELLLPKATSGGLDTTIRDTKAYFGSATEGSEADAQLEVLGGTLTANVPRMEGPQSNMDVILYQKMAGDLANSKLPINTRMAALKTLRKLNDKYADPTTTELQGKLIGTKNGKNVYQMPDGSYEMDE